MKRTLILLGLLAVAACVPVKPPQEPPPTTNPCEDCTVTISAEHLESTGSTTDASSYETGTISPDPNTLILVAVESNAATAPQPTISGLSLTWTAVHSDTTGGGATRLTVLRAYNAQTSGTLTINFGATQNQATWSIAQFSGVNSANPIVQFASAEGTGTGDDSLTVTLSAFASGGNTTYGAFGFQPSAGDPTITPGSGFTELGTGHASGDVFTEWKATADTTVDASWTNQLAVGIAIELAAASEDSVGTIPVGF